MKTKQTLQLSVISALLIGLVGCNSGAAPQSSAQSELTSIANEASAPINAVAATKTTTSNLNGSNGWVPGGNYLAQCSNPRYDGKSGILAVDSCRGLDSQTEWLTRPFAYGRLCAGGSKVLVSQTGGVLSCEIPYSPFKLGNYDAEKNNDLSELKTQNWNKNTITKLTWTGGSGWHIGKDSTFIASYFANGDFHNAYLGNADFTGAHFKEGFNFNSYAFGTNFNGISVIKGNFENGVFKDSTLRYASLANANFHGHLENVDFTGANLKNAFFYNTRIKGCKFIDADLRETTFKDVYTSLLIDDDFTGADLRGIKLDNTALSRVKLEHVNLSNTDLHGNWLQDDDLHDANLKGSNLKGSNLKGSNLRSADLTEVDLTGANVSNATWIDGTKMPDWKICALGSIGECK